MLKIARTALLALPVFMPVVMATPGQAAQKFAIFPFDIRDVEQATEINPKPKEEDLRRLKLVADELKTLLSQDNRFEVVDLTPFDAEVKKESPFNKCDGCEVPIAEKAGADIALTGFVDKWSDSLISLQLILRDAKTGQMTKGMTAEIRGNIDSNWLHAIRYLWRNRIKPQETAN